MAGKKVFMLRVNPDIYEAIEKWAADDFRSVNGQIEWILDSKLKEQRRTPEKIQQKTGIDNKQLL
ncbi:MAG: Arc family DNA binding domain-containing protein [Bacteroidetes bacterium]|nr:Arc family DNA binding domain-containing protein [Bacteroidota bacterium]